MTDSIRTYTKAEIDAWPKVSTTSHPQVVIVGQRTDNGWIYAATEPMSSVAAEAAAAQANERINHDQVVIVRPARETL